MDHYFTKTDDKGKTVDPLEYSGNENKSEFVNIFDSLKVNKDDTSVKSSPKISQLGLQTPIHERLELSPLRTKPSISNLFEDEANLFNDDSDEIDSNIAYNVNWDNIETELIGNSSFKINFKDIWRITKTIHFTSDKGHTHSCEFENLNYSSISSSDITFNINDIFDKKNFPNVNVKEVHIEDLNNKFHSIYKK